MKRRIVILVMVAALVIFFSGNTFGEIKYNQWEFMPKIFQWLPEDPNQEREKVSIESVKMEGDVPYILVSREGESGYKEDFSLQFFQDDEWVQKVFFSFSGDDKILAADFIYCGKYFVVTSKGSKKVLILDEKGILIRELVSCLDYVYHGRIRALPFEGGFIIGSSSTFWKIKDEELWDIEELPAFFLMLVSYDEGIDGDGGIGWHDFEVNPENGHIFIIQMYEKEWGCLKIYDGGPEWERRPLGRTGDIRLSESSSRVDLVLYRNQVPFAFNGGSLYKFEKENGWISIANQLPFCFHTGSIACSGNSIIQVANHLSRQFNSQVADCGWISTFSYNVLSEDNKYLKSNKEGIDRIGFVNTNRLLRYGEVLYIFMEGRYDVDTLASEGKIISAIEMKIPKDFPFRMIRRGIH